MNFYYYYTGAIAVCLISALALFEKLGNKQNPLFSNNAIYLTLISLFLFINKLSYLNTGMTDIDESVMLSAGRTLGLDPRPWISVDLATSGPINLLPATLLIKFFDNASYGELRLLYTIAFQIPTLIILFLTTNKVAGPFKARLAIVPLTLCFAFFFYYDHMHASSEQAPMFFTAVGVCSIISIGFNQIKRWQLMLTGAVCALGPFAKLQVGPLLFFICFICFSLLVLDKKRWKDAAWLVTGFAITGTIILLTIYSYGGFYDFLQSYIRSNLRYISAGYPPEVLTIFIDHNITGLLPLLLFVVFIFLWRARSITNISKTEYLYLAVWVLVLGAAVYCVIKPGRFYPHYALLLVVPLYSCFLWVSLRSAKFNKQLIPYFLGGIGILLWANISKTSKAFVGWGPYRVSNQEILNILVADGKPTDRLAVWGWGGPYLHGAKLLMGTRDVHNDFQTSYTGPIGDYYKDRFLSDLKKNRPKWFLDISGTKDFGSSEKNLLENFSGINDFVIANYEVAYTSESARLFRYKGK